MPVETRAATRRRTAQMTSDRSLQGSDQNMTPAPMTIRSTKRENNLPRTAAGRENSNKRPWVTPAVAIAILLEWLMLWRLWMGKGKNDGVSGRNKVLETTVQTEDLTEEMYPYFDSAQMMIVKRLGLQGDT